MVLTNDLISIGFSMIASFTNVVQLPTSAVPTDKAALERTVVGSPRSPIEIYMKARQGTQYWIRYGVVQGYLSPGSYSRLQNPDLIPNFQGQASLSSNDVTNLAKRVINGLLKRPSKIVDEPLTVRPVGVFQGKPLPIFMVQLATTNQTSSFRYSVELEIDARSGAVTWLDLRDDAFFDHEFESKIRSAVCRVDQNSAPTNAVSLSKKRPAAHPPEAEVKCLIPLWLTFCKRFEMPPGEDSTFEAVNWEESTYYTNVRTSRKGSVSQVRFRSGSCFEGMPGVVFSSFAADSCFSGFWDRRPKDEWTKFNGTVRYRWQDLAVQFSNRLVANFGVSQTEIEHYIPKPLCASPGLNETGLARVQLDWSRPDPTERNQMKVGFSCEFNLETGALKWVDISDEAIIRQISKSLSKP